MPDSTLSAHSDGGPNPLDSFLSRQGVIVLDGGLATTLERHGADLRDDLWSAKLLLEEPDLIRRAHAEFLEAGADCIATAGYQASFPGLAKRGLDEASSRKVLRLSVQLAIEARDAFWGQLGNRRARLRPLVAASVGPYGAYLADASEYRGDYAVSDEELYDFHLPRWRLLAETEADILACETIPSHREVRVLLEVLHETPGRWAWLSFSCRDEAHLADGTPLTDIGGLCRRYDGVAALGVNCVRPEWTAALVVQLRRAWGKLVLAYPNSGEVYDADRKSWSNTASRFEWSRGVRDWIRLGASGVGGCCRVGPGQVREVRRQALLSS